MKWKQLQSRRTDCSVRKQRYARSALDYHSLLFKFAQSLFKIYCSRSTTSVLSLVSSITPPFAPTCQLVANTITPNDLLEGQNRLQKVIRDDILESLHKQLWYAGRKGNISQLQHQKVIRRDIVLTERAQLHLVWADKTIYVKRLDDELLDWECFSKVVCGNGMVYRAASGFLLSYTRLIEYPSDLEQLSLRKHTNLSTKTFIGKSCRLFEPACLTISSTVTSTTVTNMASFASVDSTKYAAWSFWHCYTSMSIATTRATLGTTT